MTNKEKLLNNINKVHTTTMGIKRIKRNLQIEEDVINYCKNQIKDNNSKIIRKGKNYYIQNKNIIITINASSYTIITAHKVKQ